VGAQPRISAASVPIREASVPGLIGTVSPVSPWLEPRVASTRALSLTSRGFDDDPGLCLKVKEARWDSREKELEA
jgi:hypothetical protein